MIEMTSPSKTVQVLPIPDPEFRVEPQAPSSFVMPSAIEVFRVNDKAEVQWSAPTQVSSSEEARETLDKIVATTLREAERHPTSVRAQINLGQSLLNAGMLPAAIERFLFAHELDPNNVSGLAHLARVRILEGRSIEALELAQKITRLEPANVLGPMLVASAAMMEGRPEPAVEALETAIRLTPRSWIPRYLLGLVLIGQRRNRESIAHFRAAVRNEPRSAAVHHALGVAFSLEGIWRKADSAFRQALALLPNRRESVLALAQVLLHRKAADGAVEVLSHWLTVVPNDREVQELLAHSYYLTENYRAARRHLQLALQAMPTTGEHSVDRVRLLNNAGVCAGRMGDYEEAAEWYSKSIQLFPNPAALVNLAKAYRELGKTELARSALLALSEDQRDPDAQLLNGVIACELGYVDESVTILERLISKHGDTPEPFASLGCILADEKRDLQEALRVLADGRAKFPADSAILNNLAYVNLMLGNVGAARQILEAIPAEETNESVFLTATLGLRHLLEGNWEKAEHLYSSAERLARKQGRRQLAKTVRQKMHLEFAREYARRGSSSDALKHAKMGLSVGAKRSYDADLREIQQHLLSVRQLLGPVHEG